jgi:GAF domain-containing protein
MNQERDKVVETEKAAPAPPACRPLLLADLDRLSEALRSDDQPSRIFQAIQSIADEVIGFRLLTIMCFDKERFEVERVFTNMPDLYPLSGRKKKRGSAWGERVLLQLKPFRATCPEEIRQNFDDHAVITGLGLGSMLNVPVAYDGQCVGTMNLTHVEGWYSKAHEETGLLLASFLAVPLALHQSKNDLNAERSPHQPA